jgi:hypothetical protein
LDAGLVRHNKHQYQKFSSYLACQLTAGSVRTLTACSTLTVLHHMLQPASYLLLHLLHPEAHFFTALLASAGLPAHLVQCWGRIDFPQAVTAHTD